MGVVDLPVDDVGRGVRRPLRVDGDVVRRMDNPATYDADLRRDFPADLVDLGRTGNNRFFEELGGG